MCAYNKVNQTQACQNSKLINGILKQELGFPGAFPLPFHSILAIWSPYVFSSVTTNGYT
jgi:hypothetical protein